MNNFVGKRDFNTTSNQNGASTIKVFLVISDKQLKHFYSDSSTLGPLLFIVYLNDAWWNSQLLDFSQMTI
jgi:hypothetical protein